MFLRPTSKSYSYLFIKFVMEAYIYFRMDGGNFNGSSIFVYFGFEHSCCLSMGTKIRR